MLAKISKLFKEMQLQKSLVTYLQGSLDAFTQSSLYKELFNSTSLNSSAFHTSGIRRILSKQISTDKKNLAHKDSNPITQQATTKSIVLYCILGVVCLITLILFTVCLILLWRYVTSQTGLLNSTKVKPTDTNQKAMCAT